MNEQPPRYSMTIQWSDEDQTYVVSFPEWGDHTHTHGATFEEAAHNGQEVLADLIALWRRQGRALPEPQTFVVAG